MNTTRRTASHRYHHQRGVRAFVEFVVTTAIVLAVTVGLIGGIVIHTKSAFACTTRSIAHASHTCDPSR